MTHSNTNEVTKPAHYTSGSVEAIAFVEATGELEGFCLGNIIKYLYRYKLKGNPVQDLMKANEYLVRLIEHVKKNEKPKSRRDTEYWKEQQRLMQNATAEFECRYGG